MIGDSSLIGAAFAAVSAYSKVRKLAASLRLAINKIRSLNPFEE
jgi:hypothetical protein